jgi:antitoxin YefM
MDSSEVQFVTNRQGETTAVIVPIAVWRELRSELETAYLLSSSTMQRRLTEAMEGAAVDGGVRLNMDPLTPFAAE